MNRMQLSRNKTTGLLGFVSLLLPWSFILVSGFSELDWLPFSVSETPGYSFYTFLDFRFPYNILDPLAFLLVVTGSLLMFSWSQFRKGTIPMAIGVFISIIAMVQLSSESRLTVMPFGLLVAIGALLIAVTSPHKHFRNISASQIVQASN